MSAVSYLLWLTMKNRISIWRFNSGMKINNETVFFCNSKLYKILLKKNERFSALWQNSLQRYTRTAKSFTVKCPYGEVSVQRSVRLAIYPTAKCPTAKIPTAKSTTALSPMGKSPFTDLHTALKNCRWCDRALVLRFDTETLNERNHFTL